MSKEGKVPRCHKVAYLPGVMEYLPGVNRVGIRVVTDERPVILIVTTLVKTCKKKLRDVLKPHQTKSPE